MSRDRVIVDMDHILVDFFGGLLSVYNRETGENIQPDDIQGWNMAMYVQQPRLLDDIFRRPGFFRGLQPLPGARQGLELLVEAGFRPEIVSTGVTPHSYSEKAEWCLEHLGVDIRHVHLTHDKGGFRGVGIIDDGAHNIRAFRAHNPRAKAMSFDWAHTVADSADYDLLVSRRHTEEGWRAFASLLLGEIEGDL